MRFRSDRVLARTAPATAAAVTSHPSQDTGSSPQPIR